MIHPLICHSMWKLETGSRLALAADISTLLPEYCHRMYRAEPLDDADLERDMLLLNAGMEVVYGSSDLHPQGRHMFQFSYGRHGPAVNYGGHSERMRLRNVPINATFRKCAEARRTFKKFHVGLLFGGNSYSLKFVSDMLADGRGGRLQFLQTCFGDPEKAPGGGKAIPCQFRPGMIQRYLEQCNVLAMPDDGISDRLACEARASGVPVVTGRDADETMTRIFELADDRTRYEEARRQALRDSAGTDLTYEIVNLRAQLRKLQSWITTYSGCAPAHPALSTPEEASILRATLS